MPKNSFTGGGGHDIVHMKLICYNFRYAKRALFWSWNSSWCSTSISKMMCFVRAPPYSLWHPFIHSRGWLLAFARSSFVCFASLHDFHWLGFAYFFRDKSAFLPSPSSSLFPPVTFLFHQLLVTSRSRHWFAVARVFPHPSLTLLTTYFYKRAKITTYGSPSQLDALYFSSEVFTYLYVVARENFNVSSLHRESEQKGWCNYWKGYVGSREQVNPRRMLTTSVRTNGGTWHTQLLPVQFS